MSEHSAIAPELLERYRAALYFVLAEPPFTLTVDQASAALSALHAAHGVGESVFITACNPFSEALDADVNAARQAELAALLEARRLDFVPAEGRDSASDWTEPSFLVLGLKESEARLLGARFAQNAILHAGPDAIPRLVLLR